MTKEEKGKYFYILTQLIKANSNEDVPVEFYSELKKDSEPELKSIESQVSNLNDQDRVKLDEQFASLTPEEQQLYIDNFEDDSEIQSAKKGARLDFLKSLKKETTKCSCGCEMVSHKEKGGKITMKCACGCQAKNVSDALVNKVKSMKSKKK